MNQFTFWNANDPEEHVSLQFHDDGTIRHLSRDANHSVRPVWNAIGRHWSDAIGTKHFAFFRIVPHLWVAGTHLLRKGAGVSGTQVRCYPWTEAKRTANVTDPESGMRRKSVDKGQDYVAEAGASQFRVTNRHSVDVDSMHDAIEARWLARK